MPKDNKNKKEKKHFFKDFKAELKKVIWPTSKQLINNTVAVITIVVIVAVIVFVLDFAFEKLNTQGINRLKSLVETTNSVEENVNTNQDASEEIEVNSEAQAADNTENSEVAQ